MKEKKTKSVEVKINGTELDSDHKNFWIQIYNKPLNNIKEVWNDEGKELYEQYWYSYNWFNSKGIYERWDPFIYE